MHILLIFLDGIGLGDDNLETNPFAVANTPVLHSLAGGKRWLRATGYQEGERAVLVPTDAGLGVTGRPQSGTGHAVILTGRNIPKLIGRHYGPKPNPEIRAFIAEDNFFKQVRAKGKSAALINAYPPRLLYDIERGKTLRTGIQQAAHEAGLPMSDVATLYSGDTLSEDWTGQGWRKHLGYSDTPVYAPYEAGKRMVEIARRTNFAMFSHWMTDIVGHRGTLDQAVSLLETFDAVMAGALDTWDDDQGLMIITSDHGNMEAMDHGKHTENPVPTVIIGAKRQAFAAGLTDLMGLVPRMGQMLFE